MLLYIVAGAARARLAGRSYRDSQEVMDDSPSLRPAMLMQPRQQHDADGRVDMPTTGRQEKIILYYGCTYGW